MRRKQTDPEISNREYDGIRSDIAVLGLVGATTAVMGLHWLAYDAANFLKGASPNPYGSLRDALFNLAVPIFCFAASALTRHLGRREYKLIENQESEQER
jgi:hypothetical protein